MRVEAGVERGGEYLGCKKYTITGKYSACLLSADHSPSRKRLNCDVAPAGQSGVDEPFRLTHYLRVICPKVGPAGAS